jgi:NAD(P)-dependent dehydrogenase (short-subunit alcohol dehydrogenase family)
MKRVVLITGSTSGIGLETAKLFASKGYVVCVNYASNEENAKLAMSELSEYEVYLFRADVCDEKQVSQMFKAIKATVSRIDVLVNNAGTSINEAIERVDIQNFKKVIDVNLIGKVLCTKYATPFLKDASSPCIINIASRLGIKPCVGASAYCASEAAIINFTQASALELAEYGIRVNSLSPGMTLTPLTISRWTEAERENLRNRIPLKILGQPIDIASVVYFLASAESSYINGENVNVSGGILLT